MSESRPARRGFLKLATLALSGLLGAALTVPLARYILFPVRRRVVAEPGEPVDVLSTAALVAGAPPTRVELTAQGVRDAWAVADEVVLGAAWVRKTEAGEIQALSSACPHLGCAIDFDVGAQVFQCPCHRSAFGVDGARLSGPSKRGLDPLPVAVDGDRVKITFVRYRPDVPDREPV